MQFVSPGSRTRKFLAPKAMFCKASWRFFRDVSCCAPDSPEVRTKFTTSGSRFSSDLKSTSSEVPFSGTVSSSWVRSFESALPTKKNWKQQTYWALVQSASHSASAAFPNQPFIFNWACASSRALPKFSATKGQRSPPLPLKFTVWGGTDSVVVIVVVVSDFMAICIATTSSVSHSISTQVALRQCKNDGKRKRAEVMSLHISIASFLRLPMLKIAIQNGWTCYACHALSKHPHHVHSKIPAVPSQGHFSPATPLWVSAPQRLPLLLST